MSRSVCRLVACCSVSCFVSLSVSECECRSSCDAKTSPTLKLWLRKVYFMSVLYLNGFECFNIQIDVNFLCAKLLLTLNNKVNSDNWINVSCERHCDKMQISHCLNGVWRWHSFSVRVNESSTVSKNMHGNDLSCRAG